MRHLRSMAMLLSWRKRVLTRSGAWVVNWSDGKHSCFRQEERKVNLEWHPDSTVSYQRSKLWFFERERSVGPLEDTVGACLGSPHRPGGLPQPPDGRRS